MRFKLPPYRWELNKTGYEDILQAMENKRVILLNSYDLRHLCKLDNNFEDKLFDTEHITEAYCQIRKVFNAWGFGKIKHRSTFEHVGSLRNYLWEGVYFTQDKKFVVYTSSVRNNRRRPGDIIHLEIRFAMCEKDDKIILRIKGQDFDLNDCITGTTEDAENPFKE